VAVSDITGGIYNPNGLDIPSVIEHARATGSVQNFPEAENITNSELLTVECDVLIPAAMENQITGSNAHEVRARYVIEGANGPTTPEADDILNDHGVFLVPDILANAGGVIVSYFEWVQDLQSFFWDQDEVYRQLRRIMVKAYDFTLATAEKYNLDMRTAAQVGAIERVASAITMRGFYP
ncbi:MAG: glutamate dehydrogenase, partial [Chloroflexi bacterium]